MLTAHLRAGRTFAIAIVSLTLISSSALGQPMTVTRAQDRHLAAHEKTNRPFTKVTVGKVSTYFHQRRIAEATVEKDYVRYRIDESSGALIDRAEHWRTDLPDRLPTVIGRAAAEAKVRGSVERSRLVYISPRSVVYRVTPTPTDPCWIVRSTDGSKLIVTIVNAVTGAVLGQGVPPPATGLAIHGPDWGSCPQSPIWNDWADNARDWFQQLYYSPAQSIGNASASTVRSWLQSDSGSVFYELDHGGSTSFHNECNGNLSASDVASWLNGYASVPFAFIGSCEGLCNTGPSTFAYEFRKNLPDAAVVGYCGMSSSACEDCWGDSIDWQDDLFARLKQGDTVRAAFDHANSELPSCGNAQCMRFDGDTTLVLFPVAGRSMCGAMPKLPWISFSVFGGNNRDDYVRCDTTGTSAFASDGATFVFVNPATLKALDFTIDGKNGAVHFVSEHDRSKGVRVRGRMLLTNGGGIRVYP